MREHLAKAYSAKLESAIKWREVTVKIYPDGVSAEP